MGALDGGADAVEAKAEAEAEEPARSRLLPDLAPVEVSLAADAAFFAPFGFDVVADALSPFFSAVAVVAVAALLSDTTFFCCSPPFL